MVQFHPEIMRIDLRAELHLLHLVGVLVLFGFLVLLGLLVTELAVIDDAADWGVGVGGNLDEIHRKRLCLTNRFGQWENSQLLAVQTDDTDLTGADLPVDLD